MDPQVLDMLIVFALFDSRAIKNYRSRQVYTYENKATMKDIT